MKWIFAVSENVRRHRMFVRHSWKALSFTGLVLLLVGCGSAGLTSIQITPTAEYFGGPGLTAQFTAIGTYNLGDHPASHRDITDLVTWKSNAVAVATVSSTGLTTSGNNFGNTDITASMNGFGGLVVAHATVYVCHLNPSNPTQCASTP